LYFKLYLHNKYKTSDNSTSNSCIHISTTTPEIRKSLITVSIIFHFLIFLLGVLGNGLVIWVTGLKMKKTVNTVWYLNLAVADFIFVAFLPLNVINLALDFHWPFGNFMCKLNTMVLILNMFASVYILVVISADRCVSVVWPVWAQNNRNVRKALFVTLGVWGVALMIGFPYSIIMDTEQACENENKTLCLNSYAISDDYNAESPNILRQFRYPPIIIARFLVLFAVPFSIIVSCNAVIIHHLRRNHTLARKSGRPFKIIVAIIITFFLCWSPIYIMDLIVLAKEMDTSSGVIGIPLATNLAFLNSCLNPLLYVFVGKDFKKEVCKSILAAMETAFQEEEKRSQSYTKSVKTRGATHER
uniref:Formyl peptide receptor 1 n=1 Tax=Neolamprologus brichardi TaxID=32507 RepID=A0A3Q4GHB4_NEOBR